MMTRACAGAWSGAWTQVLVLVGALWLIPAGTAVAQSGLDRDGDSRTIALLTVQYLRTLDPEDPNAGLAYWLANVRAELTAEAIVAGWRSHKDAGVDFARLQPLTVTWYDRPNGVFGAVDLSSVEDAETFACGFLVWQKAGKDMKLIRQELGHLGPDILVGLDRAGLQQLTQKMACRRFVPPASVGP